ncbi:MAG: glycoside hydrolase family 4 [Haloarculaceae archaeon]
MHTLDGAGDPRTEVRIAVVGGGSRNWAPTLICDLATTTDFGGTVALYDRDEESAARNRRLGEHVQSLPDADGEWTYEAVSSLEAALDGADVVVCSTQDPPDATMYHDLEIPKEYGVYQSVGDTVGPGGVMRALRSIPQYREVAAAVREQCPDAWVLNYTNPMSVVTRTLYEEYPDINALGLCHEVAGTQRALAELVERHLDAEAAADEIALDVWGINHFTWVDEAHWRGRDLFDVLEAELADREPLPRFEAGSLADADFFVGHGDVALDLYRRYGAYPVAGDRHLAEFVPWYLRIEDPEAVHRWGFRLTPGSYRADLWPSGERRREAVLAGDRSISLERSDEEMVDVIAALLGHGALETNVNVPNRGQCPDLPAGAVVETNALLGRDRCRPLVAGPMPREVVALVETHVRNQETLVEAGFEGDLDPAFRAFRSDPLVGSLTPEATQALFRDLVEAQASSLEAYDLAGADVLEA